MNITFSYKAVILTPLLSAFALIGLSMPPSDSISRRIAYYKASINRNRNIVQVIDGILHSFGLPIMLHNLALIESDFDSKILSPAGAAGIWQLMPDVASNYGLKVNCSNDERYDLYKSTQVACRILIDLYRQYKNWTHVIAAYNCGSGRLKKAITEAGSNVYADFCRFLPQETILHVYKFQLASGINDALIGVAAIPTPTNLKQGPRGAKPIEIGAGYKLDIIAARLRLPLHRLKSLNPQFEKNLNREGGTVLYLPANKMPDFLLLQTEILTESLETEKVIKRKHGARKL